jgi:integrase
MKNQNDVNVFQPKGRIYYYAVFWTKVRDEQGNERSKQVKLCTKMTTKPEARKVGNKARDNYWKAFMGVGPAPKAVLRDESATCGEVVDVFLANSKARQPWAIANKFLAVVAEGAGITAEGEPMRAKAREIKVSSLSKDRMLDFKMQTARRQAGLELTRNQTSINSMMRIAKSIFSEESLEFYRHLRLPAGAIASWKSAKMFPKDKAGNRYRVLSEDTLLEMDASAGEMLESAREHVAKGHHSYANRWRNAYGAYLMMRRWGLRNIEAENLRWEWFVRRSDGIWLELFERSYWSPKGSERKLRIDPEFYARLVELFGPVTPGPDGFVLAGTKTDRWEGTHVEINAFIRRFIGTDRQKVAYNLRKEFGSLLVRTEGIERAHVALGHADMQTTLDHYCDDLKLAEMRPL